MTSSSTNSQEDARSIPTDDVLSESRIVLASQWKLIWWNLVNSVIL